MYISAGLVPIAMTISEGRHSPYVPKEKEIEGLGIRGLVELLDVLGNGLAVLIGFDAV